MGEGEAVDGADVGEQVKVVEQRLLPPVEARHLLDVRPQVDVRLQRGQKRGEALVRDDEILDGAEEGLLRLGLARGPGVRSQPRPRSQLAASGETGRTFHMGDTRQSSFKRRTRA